MRKLQRKLIEKSMARGKFKRLHPDISFDKVNVTYVGGYFVFEHENEVIDMIIIGEEDK